MTNYSLDKLRRIVEYYDLPIKEEFNEKFNEFKNLMKSNIDVNIVSFKITKNNNDWIFSPGCIVYLFSNNGQESFFYNTRNDIVRRFLLNKQGLSKQDSYCHGLDVDFDIEHKKIIKWFWSGKLLK